MSGERDIPKIAITQEAEDDGEDGYLSLTEVLTDVEDLNEESQIKNHPSKKHRKLKLKINLNENDYITDLEDFEASSNEDDANGFIVRHDEPISLNQLDLEGGTFEESYKIKGKTSKGKHKLRTQFSTSQRDKLERVNYKIFENCTDEELFDSDNENRLDDIPDTQFDLNAYSNEHFDVTDKVNDCTTSFLSHLEENNLNNENKQYLSTVSLSPNLSDLTDVEIVNSDTDEEICTKNKTRKMHKRNSRTKSATDVDDLELSGEDTRNKFYIKSKEARMMVKSLSLCFSANDDRLPFPVCKRIAEKRNNTLCVADCPTDIEDFDDVAEDEICSTSHAENDAIFEKTLNEMATFCIKTEDIQNSMKEEIIFNAENETINTDKDNLEWNGSELETDINCGIRFSGPNSKSDKNKQWSLYVTSPKQESLTDCENLDSSSEEDTSKKIPAAVLRQSTSFTDEEELEDGFELKPYSTEIELPPPIRNLIILKENDSLPTVQIIPLDDDSTENSSTYDTVQIMTDEESISEGEELDNLLHSDITELPNLDYGVMNVVENLQSKSKMQHARITEKGECLTDTEDIVLDVTHKRRRAPKFKHMHEKFVKNKNKLTVKTGDDSNSLTDTEDIYLSDANGERPTSLSPMLNMSGALTDVEILDDTSDEETERTNMRSMSCTPQHLRAMEGEMTKTKEGTGPFSLQDRSFVNENILKVEHFAASPMQTDTEDLGASADEDNLSYSRAETATPNQLHTELDQMSSSNIHTEEKRKFESEGVMYLKGGGYLERYTDIEEISEDEFYENKIIANDLLKDLPFLKEFEDVSLRSGTCEEWDASKQQPVDLESKAPQALEKGAVQKGENASASTSAKEPPTTTVRPEGEEGTEEATRHDRKVTDQQQLSEEMKELLKELEKESTQ